MAVKIDETKCTGCGICANLCPVQAIIVDHVARVDAEACVDCGSCVAECPNGAISIEETAASSSRRSHVGPAPYNRAMRGGAAPVSPGSPAGRPGSGWGHKPGLVRRIFDFAGQPTGQARDHGVGRRGRGGGGKGRRGR